MNNYHAIMKAFSLLAPQYSNLLIPMKQTYGRLVVIVKVIRSRKVLIIQLAIVYLLSRHNIVIGLLLRL